MKSTCLLFYLLICLFANAQQQTFSKVYYNGVDNIQAFDLMRSADNHYFIAGTGFITKTDSAGNIDWTKNYYTGMQVKFNCIIPDPDGNPVVAGYSNDGDAMIMKIDQNGDTLWARYLDFGSYSEAFTVSQVHDSGFVLCGYVNSSSVPNKMFVGRTDQDGNLIWSKTYSIGNHSNYANSVKETADSGFIVAAYAENYPPFETYEVALKLDENGNLQWCKGYSDGGSSFCSGSDVLVEGDKLLFGCYINNSFIIVKTDSAGNFLWAKDQMVFDYSGLNFPSTKLRKTSRNNFMFLIACDFCFSQNLIICDTAGTQLSATSVSMYGSAAVETADSGFMTLGNGPIGGIKQTSENILDAQFVLVKTDSTCNSFMCSSSNPPVSVSKSLSTYILAVDENISGTLYSQSFMISDIALIVADQCVGVFGGFDESENISFSVYPNPSNGAFSLHYDIPLQYEECVIELYSPLGARVFSATETMREEMFFETDNLNNGLYYLVVSSGSERVSRIVEICR